MRQRKYQEKNCNKYVRLIEIERVSRLYEIFFTSLYNFNLILSCVPHLFLTFVICSLTRRSIPCLERACVSLHLVEEKKTFSLIVIS